MTGIFTMYSPLHLFRRQLNTYGMVCTVHKYMWPGRAQADRLLAPEKVAPWLLSCSICLYTQLLLHWSWDISWVAADGGAHQTTVCAHLQQSGALPTPCTAHHLCSRGYAGTWIWGFACGRHKSSEVSLDHGAQKAPVSGCHLFSHFLMRHSMRTGLVMLEDTYNTNMPLGTLDFAGQAESQFVTLFPFAIFKKSWVDCK